ncbi:MULTISPECIES: helix-turn-helix domain-containing protein [Aerococcus]|uniref:Helix-turn-helix transcriptional regulator n=1 Tax=Aerococcus tenax TaxID=3078812 RepID=A0A329PDU4_9LACT|nr:MULTISPECIES: helix-turn-helix transcriptional regulator [Aerococcus]RAV93560.1 hypothetical protein DBT53_09720 [Aerococcus mictus]KAA9242799.1 helix-turn-helix transcriptional regulator [Aerococcus urinae]KAA9299827.1 helix-turn-helix transcriptional regulator [Aerococcus tenax]MDK7801247.1 helix-turn-helix transcriptional regulator [Aerococcus urinae]MDK8133240.1 helix-turn-helix transcriptional regulator [Aerococcus urinae]
MQADLIIAVGHRIRQLRKSLGLNQTEFAKRINATLPAVSNWETGKNLPNNERLKAIADLGGITVEYLLYGEKGGWATAEEVLSSAFNKINAFDNYLKSLGYEVINETVSSKRKATLTKDGKSLTLSNDQYSKLMNKSKEAIEFYLWQVSQDSNKE